MSKRNHKKNKGTAVVGTVNNTVNRGLILYFIKSHARIIIVLSIALLLITVISAIVFLVSSRDDIVDYTYDTNFTDKQLKTMNEQELEKLAKSKVDVNKNPTMAGYKADALTRTAKFNESIKIYQNIIDSGNGNYTVYIKKADSESLAGQYKESITSYEQAKKLMSEDSTIPPSYKNIIIDMINNKITVVKYELERL